MMKSKGRYYARCNLGANAGGSSVRITGFLAVAVLLASPLIVTGLALPGILAAAFTFMKLWNWFVAPAIGMPMAFFTSVGIVLVTQVVSSRRTLSAQESNANLWKSLSMSILVPLYTLVAGWIILQIL